MAAIVTLLGAWLTFVAKLLWDFRGRWDDTNSKLEVLAGQDKLIEQKLDLHIAWHDRGERPPGAWGPRGPRSRQ